MPKEFNFVIGGFGGLYDDPKTDTGQASQMENFEITDSGRLKRRDGYRVLKRFGGAIRALWSGTLADGEHYFAVEGVRVWHSVTGWDSLTQIGTVPGTQEVQILPFAGKVWFLGGAGIRVYDPASGYGAPVPYRPLVTVATSPAGVGTPLEEANLLGGLYRQSFSPDGSSRVFNLFLKGLDSVDYVKISGDTVSPSAYTVDLVGGKVTFNSAPPDVSDSLEIGFTREDYARSMRIDHCRRACVYGGDSDMAAFLWGDPDHPDIRYHTGLADGKPDLTYFPENSYTVFDGGSQITDIIRHYDRQLIFTENAAYYSYPQTTTDQLGRDRIYYPVYPLSAAYGSVSFGQAVLLQNDPVTVTPSGLCRWSSTQVRDERNAKIFSNRISKLLGRTRLDSLKLFVRRSNGRLIATTSMGDLIVYSPVTDQFWLHKDVCPSCFFENTAGELFFGTQYGTLCRVGGSDDAGEPIKARWVGAPLEMGRGTLTKFASRVRLDAAAGDDTKVKITWCADVEGKSVPNSGSLILKGRRRLFSFSSLDFKALSFVTQRLARRLEGRVAVRRFLRATLGVESDSKDALEIERIAVSGYFNDKRV